MSIDDMGVMNRPWGICGFTSSLYALHNNSPGRRGALEAGATSATRILAEIKTYLRLLQADGKQGILDGIEEFTQSFPGFDTWTIADYIERVNAVVVNGADQNDPNFGIGMPPSAVVDYLKRVCNFPNARIHDGGADPGEMILGMGTDRLGMPLYDGLGHYVYSLNATIYSWGNRYANPNTAMHGTAGVDGAHWNVAYKIAIT